MRAETARSGAAIIEALVAMVMLAVAGTALIALLGQTRHSMRTLRDSEKLTREASAQLDRLVLFDRAELAAREGRYTLAGWSMSVTQVAPALFDVFVARTDTGAALLGTTLYRPDSAYVDR
ncbi:MAG: hypothetical protein JWM41_4770 [Gemmatimonadetes bacterium]|nr:hypothetical protein [Gemmatimonadota bacterium]